MYTSAADRPLVIDAQVHGQSSVPSVRVQPRVTATSTVIPPSVITAAIIVYTSGTLRTITIVSTLVELRCLR